MLRIMLIFALFWTMPAHADIWRCHDNQTGRELITSAPVRSLHVSCSILDLRGAAYNVLPDQYFLYRQQLDRSAAGGRKMAGAAFAGSSTPPLPRAAPAMSLHTSLSFEEVLGPRRADAATLVREQCRVSGQARGPFPQPAEIIIRRGELTIDRIPVTLRARYQAVKWAVVLKGKCRKPEAKVQLQFVD